MAEGPLYPGEILGFRAWRLEPGGLHSLNMDHRWASVETEASCLRSASRGLRRLWDRPHPPELIPAPGCSCGIFAYRTVEMAEYYARSLGGSVLGAVACSGRMQVYRHGARAQRARILALLLPPWGMAGEPAGLLEEAASPVARELGVPLFPSNRIPEFLEYCEAQPEVAPVPEAARPGRFASLLPASASLFGWTIGVLAGVLLLIHAVHGLSEAGAPPVLGISPPTGVAAGLAVFAAIASIACCWRAMRRVDEVAYSNLLERIARIDRSEPSPRLRTRHRALPDEGLQ
jgi:hypothetical protein